MFLSVFMIRKTSSLKVAWAAAPVLDALLGCCQCYQFLVVLEESVEPVALDVLVLTDSAVQILFLIGVFGKKRAQPVPPSLLRSNSSLLSGQGSGMPSQNAFPPFMSPRNQLKQNQHIVEFPVFHLCSCSH
ncbi:unnamed protein product [Fraxinus pennsylvanica]|uniref:Uncharacterized protein n=1 Tax=Fraxinus pennsylvanica TaxID=56036 RepID=A0AAD2E3C2_9LAMI|nr:unnamed protein product [Fraxinus pennsylvanica]